MDDRTKLRDVLLRGMLRVAETPRLYPPERTGLTAKEIRAARLDRALRDAGLRPRRET
jgi:hypothetical protein